MQKRNAYVSAAVDMPAVVSSSTLKSISINVDKWMKHWQTNALE